MLLFYLLCVFSVVYCEDSPTVDTTEGPVTGVKAEDGDYYSFYGISYGGVTAGNNRFKGPTPPTKHSGVYRAIDKTVRCAQPKENIPGIENCLKLNIFTKSLTQSNPVLVWVNGEGYTNNKNNALSFKNIVDKGLVVVEINYRLSIFGFLCLGVPQAPGNAGLKDVVQAIKWIKENIKNFGGNPGNLVLFGHGSGAAMVDLLTLSPISKNSVQKAISISGSMFASWAITYDPVNAAKAIGAKLGYVDKTKEQLAELLATTDINLLMDALYEPTNYNNTPLFAPCIEDSSLNPDDTFLSANPFDLFKAGNYNQIPYIAGYVNKEGSMRVQEAKYDKWLNKMQENFTEFMPVDLYFKTNNNKEDAVNKTRLFYFDNEFIDGDTIENYVDFEGDVLSVIPILRSVKERVLSSNAEVRLFEFGYGKVPDNFEWPSNQVDINGVPHGSIINYLLDTTPNPVYKDVVESLVDYITTFVKTGEPISRQAATWLEATPSSFYYLHFGGGPGAFDGTSSFIVEIKRDPRNESFHFWDSLYSKYYLPPKSVSSVANVVTHSIYDIVALIIPNLLLIKLVIG